ncbi:hypothetical protein GH714_022071 [Hevea brasiliensis]|uniref:DUF629 domain-containing protein n=1 Tax=Hevea brasiliensis TaxID=3981 RepID=A0A6A6MC75_HEVBR|nr:hypothetical protein GH714_022071 [Hevea brasiliensis]
MHHIVQEHMGSLIPKMQAVLPRGVDNEWVEMVLNCSWKPLDLSSAVKMLGSQGKGEDADLVEDFCSGGHNEECDDCFKDASNSSPKKENLRDSYNDFPTGSNDADKGSSIDCKECDGKQGSMAYTIDSWPLSEDSERGKLLEKIHAVFEALIKHKYLAELSHSCGLGRYSEKSSTVDDVSAAQGPEIKEKIVLNGDASCLYLDECLLPSECTPGNFLRDDMATVTSTNVGYGNGVQPDAAALLSWIFAGPLSGSNCNHGFV